MTPVAVFVYNRVDNTRRTLAALMQNTLVAETDVYVFADGGKDERSWKQVNEVRSYLHELEQNHPFRSLTLVLRPENYYLERNIIEGIDYVLQHYDTICVLEDDIVTSPYFLQFINDALTTYQDDPRVMHIGGFTNLEISSMNQSADGVTTPSPCGRAGEGSAFYFTPHMAGWGWATWRDRWQQHFHHFQSEEEALAVLTPEDIDAIQYGGVFPCLKSLKKNPIPWDCCWEIAIRKAGGLCLYPTHTLVRNIGLRNGTHFSSSRLLQRYAFDREPLQHPVPVTRQTPAVDPAIEDLFREAIRDWGIRYTWLGKTLRWFYHLVKH